MITLKMIVIIVFLINIGLAIKKNNIPSLFGWVSALILLILQ